MDDSASKVRLITFLQKVPLSTDSPKKLSLIAPDISLDFKAAAFVVLQSFNILEIIGTSDDPEIKTHSILADRFLGSYIQFLKSDVTLFDEWEADTSLVFAEKNMLSHGFSFLKAMEERRFDKVEKPIPLDIQLINLYVLKCNVGENSQPLYLMQFNQKTNYFQFIGGKVIHDESDEDAGKRLLKKELSFVKEAQLAQFNIQEPLNIISTRISHRNGIIARYDIRIFPVEIPEITLKLSKNDMWVSIEEIEQSIARKQYALKTPVDDVKDHTEFLSWLKALPQSNATSQEDVVPAISITKNTVDEESLSAELLVKEESETLEFKSSLRWDYAKNELNRELEKVIAKTLSAFLNCDGGKLIIGISDKKEILGIQPDIATLPKQNEDGFMQHIVSIITTYLGVEYVPFCTVGFLPLQKKRVCVIEVKASTSPVFMKENQKRDFYVRAGNTSRLLNSEETYKYISSHW